MLFLSYTKADSEIARKISEWFRGQKVEVFRWEDLEQRGSEFIPKIERAMHRADAFLAIMSPDFVRSAYCRKEAALAIQREVDMRTSDPDADYIRVLLVRPTPHLQTGFLASYDWLDVTSEEKMQQMLPGIVRRFAGNDAPSQDSGDAETEATIPPTFRNRDDEVDRVLRGLTNAAGPHFWLVIAAPQLGKTWFMGHLATKMLGERVNWETGWVDVRDYPEDARGDVKVLLMDLFGLPRPVDITPNGMRSIAQTVLAQRKPYLCLIDSGELLDEQTAGKLRWCLGEIYRHVQRASIHNVRLGLIVASRQDDGWRGVTPDPRLTPLPLTQFKPDVVRDALHDLAREMGRTFGTEELTRNATRAYHLTEGLPALLALCIRWIQKEEWLDLERLESQEIFQTLTGNYIKNELLSNASLLPCRQVADDEPRRALEHAFRALAPYRLFTQSHLRYHLEKDTGFERALADTEWNMEELWARISYTALLRRPLDEPWQETQMAIRRLLFRHFNKTDERRIEAHQRARHFAEVWWDGQTGNEQVIGLIECLWHEAVMLRLSHAADMEETLCRSAKTFASSLRPSSLYTKAELRRSAARRIRNDEEFQDIVDNIDGLFIKLAEIVELKEGS